MQSLYKIAAFYRFTPLQDLSELKRALLAALEPLSLCGTLLLAPEGCNGTLSGSEMAIASLQILLQQQFGIEPSEIKFSFADAEPFGKLKIRLKREIITFNQPAADPLKQTGTHVSPQDWNALLDDPEITVIDTRNTYETMIGSFRGAERPTIDSFTEFAAYVRERLDPARNKKIAMFCTGGIRCEKASAFMLAEGFDEVFQLQGGILKYLEEVVPEKSRWDGECYVFDRRMAVGHGLTTGRYSMCFNCGFPLTEGDRAHPAFEEGVACHHCNATTSDEDKARFRTRHHQMLRDVEKQQNTL